MKSRPPRFICAAGGCNHLVYSEGDVHPSCLESIIAQTLAYAEHRTEIDASAPLARSLREYVRGEVRQRLVRTEYARVARVDAARYRAGRDAAGELTESDPVGGQEQPHVTLPPEW